MRVHVISDMEGVAGIVKGQQTLGGEPLYDEGRRLYTAGDQRRCSRREGSRRDRDPRRWTATAQAQGWSFNSLLPEDLDPACEYVVQHEWTEYTEFLEQGCDAALLVGMHARAGTPTGVMNHTISGRDYQNLWFNDVLVGETGIHAALCGTWDCPVLLVTGDEASCNEGKELLGDGLTTVAVKSGFSSQSARTLTPARARELIEQGAKDALADLTAVPPWSPGSPCEIRAEFKNTLEADKLRFRAGVERVDERTIVSRADTWLEAWRQYYF